MILKLQSSLPSKLDKNVLFSSISPLIFKKSISELGKTDLILKGTNFPSNPRVFPIPCVSVCLCFCPPLSILPGMPPAGPIDRPETIATSRQNFTEFYPKTEANLALPFLKVFPQVPENACESWRNRKKIAWGDFFSRKMCLKLLLSFLPDCSSNCPHFPGRR